MLNCAVLLPMRDVVAARDIISSLSGTSCQLSTALFFGFLNRKMKTRAGDNGYLSIIQVGLWIGLQRHLKQTDQQYTDYCVELSQHHHLPITACGGVLMHNANRLPLQHSLTAIKYQKPITEVGSHLLANAERCLRSINKLSPYFQS